MAQGPVDHLFTISGRDLCLCSARVGVKREDKRNHRQQRGEAGFCAESSSRRSFRRDSGTQASEKQIDDTGGARLDEQPLVPSSRRLRL